VLSVLHVIVDELIVGKVLLDESFEDVAAGVVGGKRLVFIVHK